MTGVGVALAKFFRCERKFIRLPLDNARTS
jgi:hypothetical protein